MLMPLAVMLCLTKAQIPPLTLIQIIRSRLVEFGSIYVPFAGPPPLPHSRTTEPFVGGEDEEEFNSLDVAAVFAQLEMIYPTFSEEMKVASVDDGLTAAPIMTTAMSQQLHNTVRQAYLDSPIHSTLLEALQKDDISLLSPDAPPEIKAEARKGKFHIMEGLIWHSVGLRSSVLVIDDATQTALLDSCHDEPMAGHFSTERTLQRPWQYVNMDFVTGLPPAGALSYNAALVVTAVLEEEVASSLATQPQMLAKRQSSL
jgi:hypothetical protein